MTLVEGVFSLPPGHSLFVACDSPLRREARRPTGISPIRRARPLRTRRRDLGSAARAVRPLLEEAVRSHLHGGCPARASSSAAGSIPRPWPRWPAASASGLHTFTVAFPEREFSEAPLARQTAKRLGTEHRELLLTPDDMAARLARGGDGAGPAQHGRRQYIFRLLGGAPGGTEGGALRFGRRRSLRRLSDVPQYAAHRKARDAARADVPRPRAAAMAGNAARMEPPRAASRSAPTSLRKVAADLGRRRRAAASVFLHAHAVHPQASRAAEFAGGSSEARARRAFARRTLASLGWTQTVEQAEQLQGDSAVSCLELRTYMLDTLLRDTDAMSMHHSLEVRVPLARSPAGGICRRAAGWRQAARRRDQGLLAEALGDLLPEEVVRQPKRTFTFPWERWLRGPLGLQVALRLGGLTPSLAALLDTAMVQTIWRSFLLGRTGWARPWSLFVLNEWVRQTPGRGGIVASSRTRQEPRLRALRCPERSKSRMTGEARVNILGINAYHGNASAALVCDGRLVAAVEEERFNRVKYAAGFPVAAIRYCLEEAGITLAEVDHVAVPRNPWARLGTKLLYALRMPRFARERAKVLKQFVGIPEALAQAFDTDPEELARPIPSRRASSGASWPARFLSRRSSRRRCFPPTAWAISPAPCGPPARATACTCTARSPSRIRWACTTPRSPSISASGNSATNTR